MELAVTSKDCFEVHWIENDRRMGKHFFPVEIACMLVGSAEASEVDGLLKLSCYEIV